MKKLLFIILILASNCYSDFVTAVQPKEKLIKYQFEDSEDAFYFIGLINYHKSFLKLEKTTVAGKVYLTYKVNEEYDNKVIFKEINRLFRLIPLAHRYLGVAVNF